MRSYSRHSFNGYLQKILQQNSFNGYPQEILQQTFFQWISTGDLGAAGAQILPKRAADGRSHVPGELSLADWTTSKKIFNISVPLLRAGGCHNKMLLSPLPRYINIKQQVLRGWGPPDQHGDWLISKNGWTTSPCRESCRPLTTQGGHQQAPECHAAQEDGQRPDHVCKAYRGHQQERYDGQQMGKG